MREVARARARAVTCKWRAANGEQVAAAERCEFCRRFAIDNQAANFQQRNLALRDELQPARELRQLRSNFGCGAARPLALSHADRDR